MSRLHYGTDDESVCGALSTCHNAGNPGIGLKAHWIVTLLETRVGRYQCHKSRICRTQLHRKLRPFYVSEVVATVRHNSKLLSSAL